MLLQPTAQFSKIVSGAGDWRVSRSEYGQPFFCVILDGSSLLAVAGHAPIVLEEGDFILIPSARDFTMSNVAPSRTFDSATSMFLDGEIRHGIQTGPADVRSLVGYCVFGSSDAALLVSLLPQLIHVRGESRLSTLVQLVAEEARTRRPARDIILSRLLEVLLIEALRSTGTNASPCLLRGLADERVALAIRGMHDSPNRRWTIEQLAREAALSRSAFFDRFSRTVGVAPIEYLLGWRMALAKNLLRRTKCDIADVAERVGYSSASAFSVAFTRHAGLPPTRYAREQG